MQQRSNGVTRRQFLEIFGITGLMGVGLGLAGRFANETLSDEIDGESSSTDSSFGSSSDYPAPRKPQDGEEDR